jgi:pimeloyl-ACP methyl ester carboxylesterase
MSFARSAGRLVRTSSGIVVSHGAVHPPLAAHTARTPRDWKAEVGAGGAGDTPPPLFLFCHATGFCKEVWLPVVEELTKLSRAPFRWAALDFAGHGDSRPLPDSADWATFAPQDIAAALAPLRRDAPQVIGVGHSMGGAALLLAHLSGEALSRLVLFEPIVGVERHGPGVLAPLQVLASSGPL